MPDTRHTAHSPQFQCAAIIGIGLMGGSLGMALRTRQLAGRVIGIDTREETLHQAVQCGAIDTGTTDIAIGIPDADLIVIAAPLSCIPELLTTIAPHVRPDALLTDIGSVKERIVREGERIFGPRFVGSHPMAGSEKSGITAANLELFQNAAWAIVRPAPFNIETDRHALRLAELIEALGAIPIPLDSARHDRIAALVSHLPHLLSFAFAKTIAAYPDAAQARQMAGGSCRDLLRVSTADPALWHSIFHENRPALLESLTEMETQIALLKEELGAGDQDNALPAKVSHFITA